MKKLIVFGFSFAVVVVATGDVFSDAALLYRGMGVDLNGNGLLDASDWTTDADVETIETLTGSNKPYTINGTGKWFAFGDTNDFRFVTGAMAFPHRNETRTAQYIHVSPTLHTNDTTVTGWPTSLYLRWAFTTNTYAVHMRFRPDIGPRHAQVIYLLTCGYVSGRGVQIGLSQGTSGDTDWHTNETNSYLRLNVCGTSPTGGVTDGPFIEHGLWTDLVLSIDGLGIRVLVQQEGRSSIVKNYTLGSGLNATPVDGTKVINLLAVSAFVTSQSNTLYVYGGGDWRMFCGDFQQFACWDRALSWEEMHEAASGGRPWIFRVGAANGKSIEFNGTAGTTVSVTDLWRKFPASLAAAESNTASFRLEAWQSNLPQMFTFTPVSGEGRLAVSVNGQAVCDHTVKTGAKTLFYIPATFFVTGTNTLTVMRTDTGAHPIVVDAFELGGSWQLGKEDRGYGEFTLEGQPFLNNFYLADGNWLDLARAFVYPVSSSITSHVPVKAEMTCSSFKYEVKAATQVSTPAPMRLTVNGIEKYHGETGFTNYTGATVNFVPGELHVGDNVFVWEALESKSAVFDYYRFWAIEPPSGTFISFK